MKYSISLFIFHIYYHKIEQYCFRSKEGWETTYAGTSSILGIKYARNSLQSTFMVERAQDDDGYNYSVHNLVFTNTAKFESFMLPVVHFKNQSLCLKLLLKKNVR